MIKYGLENVYNEFFSFTVSTGQGYSGTCLLGARHQCIFNGMSFLSQGTMNTHSHSFR